MLIKPANASGEPREFCERRTQAGELDRSSLKGTKCRQVIAPPIKSACPKGRTRGP